MNRFRFVCGMVAVIACAQSLPKDDGYRGIWYYNQPSHDQYVYKYSGGFATYPQQHAPIAIYSPEAKKTFFCYGGTVQGKRELLHMVSYYDHTTGMVPRPTVLLNKHTDDAHDNPTISIDRDGYIWIFSAAHGTSRPAFIHRSTKPYSVDDFERIEETNFSYPQPWYLDKFGFLFLHTRYTKLEGGVPGRMLHWMTSADGRSWSEPQRFAFIEMGDYQISWPDGNRVATAFDYHPRPVGLNTRTNIYYAETSDFGKTWTNVQGEKLTLPLREAQNPALVRDYKSEGQLVYLKDLNYDRRHHPVILFLTAKTYESGPKGGPRMFQTAQWTGSKWEYRPVAPADHNYDHGSLWIESNGEWRVIAPTEPGPQAHGTGGDIAMFASRDEGRNWRKVKDLTQGSRRNHTYVRRPLHAQPDFYAIWADGDAFAPSESHIYFCNREGDVFVLPAKMTKDFERPQKVR